MKLFARLFVALLLVGPTEAIMGNQTHNPIFADGYIVVYGYSWYTATSRFPTPEQVRNDATTVLTVRGANQYQKLEATLRVKEMRLADSTVRDQAGPIRIVIDFYESQGALATTLISDGCNIYSENFSQWRELDMELYDWLSSVILSNLPDCWSKD